MRSRRGEVSFVAIRIGRSNDPRECLALAMQLKVERATALGYLALWEEFILEVGDAMTGRVRGYRPEHLAAKLGWTGKPAVLVDALKRAGVLGTQRNTLSHPYWLQSITGQYARDRATLREDWRAKKAEQRRKEKDGQPEDVSEMSPGRLGDKGAVSQGTADIDRLTNGHPARFGPPNPPQSGGSLGATRWEWVLQNHSSPRNSGACTRYLAALDDEKWALCQWVLTEARRPGAFKHSRKKRVLQLDSHKFLSTEAYLQFRPEWVQNHARAAAPPEVAAVRSSPADEAAARRASGVAFVLAQLADSELSEEEKARAKRRWQDNNPGDPLPWAPQDAPGGPPGDVSAGQGG